MDLALNATKSNQPTNTIGKGMNLIILPPAMSK